MFEEKNINGKILYLKNSKILKNSIDKDYWICHREMRKYKKDNYVHLLYRKLHPFHEKLQLCLWVD